MENDEKKLGATQLYPEGKLNPDDEGELRFAVTTDLSNGVVVMQFGKAVKWLAVQKELAIAIGKSIIEHAEKLP